MSIVLINSPLLDHMAHNDVFEICYNHAYYRGQPRTYDNMTEKCEYVDKLRNNHVSQIKLVLSRIPVGHKKFVVGHYPLHSNGVCHNYMKGYRALLFPIFAEYKVDLYLCGHEHNTQKHVWYGCELTNYVPDTLLEPDWHFCQCIAGGATEVGNYDFRIDDGDVICMDYNLCDNCIVTVNNAAHAEFTIINACHAP